MPADTIVLPPQAAGSCSEVDKRARAEQAATAAQCSHEPVTVAGIAGAAGMSSSWAYTQVDLSHGGPGNHVPTQPPPIEDQLVITGEHVGGFGIRRGNLHPRRLVRYRRDAMP